MFHIVWAMALTQSTPIVLKLDATEAGRYIIRAHETIPATAGPFTLVYPKWIPGHHRPTGPLNNLADLHFHANGVEVPWRRDDVDMYAFHLSLPEGTQVLVADFAEMSQPGQIATPNFSRISTDQCVLYPWGSRSDDVTIEEEVVFPMGWDFGTALPISSRNGQDVVFEPDSMTRVVDSPIVAGRFFKKVVLNQDTPIHEIDMAADSPRDLEMKPETLAAWKRLPEQELALFGARHYRDYHWLLTLSDHGGYIGLEHHECSEDGLKANGLSDAVDLGTLVAHEFTHSWNGKYRRPAGLATQNYQAPMKGDLLWVYEGLTQYLGELQAERSGLITSDQFRTYLAQAAGWLENERGRTWRPLEDTAISVQLTYSAPEEWGHERRGADYYDEGALCWLEADTIIRLQSLGTRSLNDFLRIFFGGKSGLPEIKTYVFADVIAALNQVQPYNWASFWHDRLDVAGYPVPVGGILNGGWKLDYTDQPVDSVTFEYSLGLSVGDDGTINDVLLDMPAFKAGIAPGMKILKVNGKAWSISRMRDAVRSRKDVGLTVGSAGSLEYVSVSYSGGERYPHLTRDPSGPNLLAEVLAPLAR